MATTMIFKSHFLAICIIISLTTWSTYGQSTCSCDFVNNTSPNCVVETATSGRCNPVACQTSFVCVAEGSSTCAVSTESRSIFRFTGIVGQDQPCEQVSATVAVITQQTNVATGFKFLFDDTYDDTLTPPYVAASGNFTFDDFQNKPDGTYSLTSLPNYAFFFVSEGDIFTNADIRTPLANILVRITTVGSERFVTFGGSGGGPSGGSIDMFQSLSQPSSVLTLGSSFNVQYLFLRSDTSHYGTYVGSYKEL